MENKNLSIEEKIKRVEEIAQEISNPSVSLDVSLELLKEANTLTQEIEKEIQNAKEQLESLK